MDKIRVAVTGAAGQVGSVMVRKMLEFSHIEPVAICRNDMSAGLIHFNSPGANIRIGSITEIDSARELLGDCDVIINCALASVKGSPKKSHLLNKTMIDNFSRLEQLKSLIHLSSASVYGACINSAGFPKNTFERPRSDSDYGRSKFHIEKHVKRRFLSKQLNYYILRLGHVYGARTDRSKQIIEFARNPDFQLPFNGELPSNTIHVERLADMIIALFSNPLPSGIYNVADEHQTWRQVFDWHTQAIGLPSVKAMSKDSSNRLRTLFLSRSIMGDIGSWLRSLPILSLIRYPAIFDSIFRFLYIIPPSMTSRLATTYKRFDVKRQIAAVTRHCNVMVPPVYFSDAMPGTYLALPSDVQVSYPSSEELSNQLRKWHHRFSQPRWLPNSIHE